MIWRMIASVLGALLVLGSLVWRIEYEAARSLEHVQRQPAEAMVHARRVMSIAFPWQPAYLAAKDLLSEEIARAPTSIYSRRSLRDAERSRRSLAEPWKIIGIAGFFAFVAGVYGAIAAEHRRRRKLLGILAIVGFAVFALGMRLL